MWFHKHPFMFVVVVGFSQYKYYIIIQIFTIYQTILGIIRFFVDRLAITDIYAKYK